MALPTSIQQILDSPELQSDFKLLGGTLRGGTKERNEAAQRVERARDTIEEQINALGLQSSDPKVSSQRLLSGALLPFGAGQFLSTDEYAGRIGGYSQEDFANLFGSPKAWAEYTLGGGKFENLSIPETQLSTGGKYGARTLSVPTGTTYQVNPQGVVLTRGNKAALTAGQFQQYQDAAAPKNPLAPTAPEENTSIQPQLPADARLYREGGQVFYTDGQTSQLVPPDQLATLGINPMTLGEGLASAKPLGDTGQFLAPVGGEGVQGVFKRGNDVFVTENGQPRHIELDEFKSLGINYDFLQEGTPVSLEQARTGKAPVDGTGGSGGNSGAGTSGTSAVTVPEQDREVEVQTQADDLLKQYGLQAVPDDFNLSPMQSFEATYTALADQLGLAEVKGQIEGALADLRKIDEEAADKIAEVGENPWLSEGLRSRKIRALQEKYEGRRQAANSNLQLLQTLYDRGRDEAKFISTTALNAYYKNRDFQQDQLEFLVERADKAAEAKAKLAKDSTQTQIIQLADGRDVLVNRQTGEIIRTIGGARSGSGGGGGTRGGGSGSLPSWEEFLARAEEEAKQTFTPAYRAELRKEYDRLVAENRVDTTGLSREQKLKLEQAGLLKAGRRVQLDYLYDKPKDDALAPPF